MAWGFPQKCSKRRATACPCWHGGQPRQTARLQIPAPGSLPSHRTGSALIRGIATLHVKDLAYTAIHGVVGEMKDFHGWGRGCALASLPCHGPSNRPDGLLDREAGPYQENPARRFCAFLSDCC